MGKITSLQEIIDKTSVRWDKRLDNNIKEDDTESVIDIPQEHQDNEVDINDNKGSENVRRRSTRVTTQPVRCPMDVLIQHCSFIFVESLCGGGVMSDLLIT